MLSPNENDPRKENNDQLPEKEKEYSNTVLFLGKYGFYISIIIDIIAAYLLSPLTTSSTGSSLIPFIISNIIIPFIFLFSGLKIDTEKAIDAVKNYKFHFISQISSYIFFPLIVWIVVNFILLIYPNFSKFFVTGLYLVASLPTMVNANVILTKASKGNEALSILNAVLGNVLGTVASPFCLIILLSTTKTSSSDSSSNNISNFNVISVIIKLLLTILLPFIIGQLIKKFKDVKNKKEKGEEEQEPKKEEQKQKQKQKHPMRPSFQNVFLLAILFYSFSNLFGSNASEVSTLDIFILAVTVIGLHILILVIFYSITSISSFPFLYMNIIDRTAFIYISTTKTLPVGISLATSLATGSDLSLVLLPLFIYHPFQFAVGGISSQSFFLPRNKEYEKEQNIV